MSDADKLKQARELITAKKYAEARKLLQTISEPEYAQTAQRWLKKLDTMQKKTPAAKPSKMGYTIDRRAVQGAVIGLLVGLVIGGGAGFVAGRDSVINQIQRAFFGNISPEQHNATLTKSAELRLSHTPWPTRPPLPTFEPWPTFDAGAMFGSQRDD